MDKYRNFIKISKKQVMSILKKFNKKDIEFIRGGNIYSSFVKVYLLTDQRMHYKPIMIYMYASVKDPKSVKREFKKPDFFINPIYSNLIKDEK